MGRCQQGDRLPRALWPASGGTNSCCSSRMPRDLLWPHAAAVPCAEGGRFHRFRRVVLAGGNQTVDGGCPKTSVGFGKLSLLRFKL